METNGKPVKISSLVQAARDRLVGDDGTLLLDMKEGWSAIRSFLLGGQRNGQQWPAGQIYVSRGERYVQVTLSVRTLGIECRYTDGDVFALAEIIENDLDCGTVPWQLNYKEREREENKRLRAVE